MGSFHGNKKETFYRTPGSAVGLRALGYLWYLVILQSDVAHSEATHDILASCLARSFQM